MLLTNQLEVGDSQDPLLGFHVICLSGSQNSEKWFTTWVTRPGNSQLGETRRARCGHGALARLPSWRAPPSLYMLGDLTLSEQPPSGILLRPRYAGLINLGSEVTGPAAKTCPLPGLEVPAL